MTEVGPGAVEARRGGAPLRIQDVDSVVVAAGAAPATGLLAALEALVPEVAVVGDARAPRSALEAVAEGSRWGREIGGRARR